MSMYSSAMQRKHVAKHVNAIELCRDSSKVLPAPFEDESFAFVSTSINRT